MQDSVPVFVSGSRRGSGLLRGQCDTDTLDDPIEVVDAFAVDVEAFASRTALASLDEKPELDAENGLFAINDMDVSSHNGMEQ